MRGDALKEFLEVRELIGGAVGGSSPLVHVLVPPDGHGLIKTGGGEVLLDCRPVGDSRHRDPGQLVDGI